jgi:hypothetical protein
MRNAIKQGLEKVTGWAAEGTSSSPSPDVLNETFSKGAGIVPDATAVVRMVLSLPPRVDHAASRFYRALLVPVRVLGALREELLESNGRELFKHVLDPLDLAHVFHPTADVVSGAQFGCAVLPASAGA